MYHIHGCKTGRVCVCVCHLAAVKLTDKCNHSLDNNLKQYLIFSSPVVIYTYIYIYYQELQSR